MSVLVTGGAGYIGSHMVLDLLEAGEEVVVLDNLSTGVLDNVAPDARVFVGDVGDEALVRRLLRAHRVDAILHFAGSIVVPDSVFDPLGYYLNNTVKTRSMLAAAVAEAVPHVIFSSTAAVYGVPERLPIAEDSALRPLSPYGTSKLMTELMLADVASAHGMSYAALRYFNVAGADPAGRTGQSGGKVTHLIRVACQAALRPDREVSVYGTDYPTMDGTCVRDYVHVSDLARAHRAALRYLRQGGASRSFNCGYGTGHSVMQVLQAVGRQTGSRLKTRSAERRPGDPAILVADVARIQRELEWVPQFGDLGSMVEHALRWEEKLLSSRRKQPGLVVA